MSIIDQYISEDENIISRWNLLFVITCFSIFFAPFSGIDVLIFLSAADILIILGVVILIIRSSRGVPIQIPKSAGLVLLAGGVFLVIQVLTIPRATNSTTAIQWIRTYVGVLAVFLLIVASVDSRRDISILLQTIAISVVVISLLTITQTLGITALGDMYLDSRSIFGLEIPFRRTLGVPMDYGNFGLYLSIGISYLLYEIFHTRNRLAGLFLPIPLLATIISQSRSTWAAIGLVLTIFMIYQLEQFRSHKISHITPWIFWGFLGTVIAVLALFIGRILIRINPLTLESRLSNIIHSLDIFLRAPFLGLGRYTFYLEYGDEIIHNGFINILVAYGGIGFLLFLSIYLLTGFMLVRDLSNKESPILIVGLLAAFLGMTVELMFFDGSYTKILWIVLAVIHLSISYPFAAGDSSGGETVGG